MSSLSQVHTAALFHIEESLAWESLLSIVRDCY